MTTVPDVCRHSSRSGRWATCFATMLASLGVITATPAPGVHAAPPPVGTIDTVVGTIGDGGPAAQAYVAASLITTDASGNVFASDRQQVREINIATGIISTVAGSGASHSAAGDGGPATAAAIGPGEVAVAPNGDMYIGDSDNYRVRKVTAATGIITTVAGTGLQAYSGDNGPATSASLQSATGVALDSLGNLYIADPVGNRIRKVVLATGIITTVAGTGVNGYDGDNQPAVNAELGFPYSLTVDSANNLYVTERQTNRIRKIDTNGVITTAAGTGLTAYNGEGAANTVNLNSPGQIKWFNDSLYFSEPSSNRVRRVDLAANTVSMFAGTGVNGSSGDGGPADQAQLDLPFGVAVGPTGTVYIADLQNRIRAVSGGTITAFAGVGAPFAGDGGPGTSAIISGVLHVAVDTLGNVYIGDVLNARVRKLNVASGIITTIAGTGDPTFNGDGHATTSNVSPDSIALDDAGNMYIAETYSGRIRKLTVSTGMLTTIAGTGNTTSNGDGPTATTNIFPRDIAFDANGDLWVADSNTVRKLTFADSMITTIAGTGTGTGTYNGDGPKATTNVNPESIAVAPNGDIYIGEAFGGRVRKLSLGTGMISTVAGTGTTAFNGDGPALGANLSPYDLTVDDAGDVYIADSSNSRVRKLTVAPRRRSRRSPASTRQGSPVTAGPRLRPR